MRRILDRLSLNIYQKLAVGFYIFLCLFWIFIHLQGYTDGFYNYSYSFLFGLIPLFAGVVAMIQAKAWGGLESAVGKAVFFIGLGIFCWGAGETVWSYYNFFLGTAAPYPSIADLGFAPSIFFYGIGVAYLSKATGAKFGLRNPFAKVFLAVALVLTILVSYYLVVVVARGGVIVPEGEPLLKMILDIAYPLGDVIAFMASVIISGLSFKYLGGKYIVDIYAILAGLLAMFIGDTIFSYATTVGTYYNANFGDLILSTGVFLLSFGVLGFVRPKTGDSWEGQ